MSSGRILVVEFAEEGTPLTEEGAFVLFEDLLVDGWAFAGRAVVDERVDDAGARLVDGAAFASKAVPVDKRRAFLLMDSVGAGEEGAFILFAKSEVSSRKILVVEFAEEGTPLTEEGAFVLFDPVDG